MGKRISDIPTHNTAPGGTNKMEMENPTGPASEYCTLDEMIAARVAKIVFNAQPNAYTTVLTDNGKAIFHAAADTTARTYTIDSNANVAYPIGALIHFINQHGAGTLTIAIATDTMRLAGAGTTGNRSLSADGMASAIKVDTTEWLINGNGLS